MGKEIYISTDVESDGPIPGVNSMLSFASVALTTAGDVISTFEVNLELLEGAVQDDDTMAWWSGQTEAWKYCRENLQPIEKAMQDYLLWVEELPGTPVFVAYPAGYDFMFMYWYMMRFVKKSPFSFSALDIKTYASAVLRIDFRKTTKDRFKKEWFDKRFQHSHKTLDDAMEQGLLFINMRKAHYAGYRE